MTPELINNHKIIATKEQIANMDRLADLITQLELMCGQKFVVTSGLRTPQLQMQINPAAAKGSAHLTGEAVDVEIGRAHV